MRIGIYSITYRGVWYRGEAVNVFDLLRLAKQQGWEGVELDAERPHAVPMDFSPDDRRRLRDLAGELDLPICAVSPNCDLSSPVPVHREAMICYVRECIKLAHDLGSPLCKIFAAWRDYPLRPSGDLRRYVRLRFVRLLERGPPGIRGRESARTGESRRRSRDCAGLQNHGPDVVNRYQDVLSLIQEVDSPAFKACMDINIEPEPESVATHARWSRPPDRFWFIPTATASSGVDPMGRWSWWPEVTSTTVSGVERWPILRMWKPWWRRATTATSTGSSAIPPEKTGSRRASTTYTSKRGWRWST